MTLIARVALIGFSLLPDASHAIIYSSCGENLRTFVAEKPAGFMAEEQVNYLLQTHFPTSSLDSREEIDMALANVGQDLFKIQAEMQTIELLQSQPEFKDVNLNERIMQARHRHEFLAVLLVALKARRARVFRPIDN
jgi:hypothetical protein